MLYFVLWLLSEICNSCPSPAPPGSAEVEREISFDFFDACPEFLASPWAAANRFFSDFFHFIFQDCVMLFSRHYITGSGVLLVNILVVIEHNQEGF